MGVLVTETAKKTDSGRSGVELDNAIRSQVKKQKRMGKDGLLE